MDDLKGRGLLFHKTRERHSYPHCWRCDTPLFYVPAPAWFIRTTAIRERMLEQNRRVRWVPPEVGAGRFGEWLENNVDWNISRDRYWGTPLPFWTCEACGAEEALASAAEMRERAGSLPEGFDHHKPSIDAIRFPCKACGGAMRRTGAVLDCWFDSGAMPFAQHGWPHLPGSREKLAQQFPASFICEGVDQTRGWFYTLHAIGAFVTGLSEGLPDAPAFGSCLVNGLVLDKDGVKMSKRLGNVVDPWKLVGEHGADAVRWYLVGSAAPWLSKRLDPEALLDVRRRFFRSLLQSYDGFFRVYAEIDAFDPRSPQIPPVAERPPIDRWLVSRTQSVVERSRGAYAAHDLFGALRVIEDFTVDELSNWYIRRNRRRFWKGETGPDKLSAHATLYGALEAMTLCMAPLAPFTAELLWRRLRPDEGSVHRAAYPEADERLFSAELEEQMAVVQRLVVMGRALRERAGIKTRQPLRAIHVRCSDAQSLRVLASDFAAEQIQDELNVKAWGSLGADDGELCRLVVRPNFRALGPRLGPRMKTAAAAIAKLSGTEAAALRSGRGVRLALEDEVLELGPGDVEVAVESRAGFDVEADGRFVVWLDTSLDQELVDEGVVREVVNRVNALRKARGLAVEERIALELHPRDGGVARAIERHRELLTRETLASALTVSSDPLGPEKRPETWDLGEGRVLEGTLRAS
jgi:isoleucyl-tRNA synthetase